MSLRIQPLIPKLTDCGPEARFILETIARGGSHGGSAGECFRGKLLAKQLHMVEGIVSAALGELLAVGVVERLESARAGKGRPKISYQIAPQSLATLEGQQCSHASHPEHLKRLFSGADIPAELLGAQPKPQRKRSTVTKLGKPAPPGARSRLSICNRLLLGALLANADQFGVVTGLSNLDLRRLTGLDSESLSHRLQRLRGVGLIRSYVPGVTSSVFRTKKVNSSYFLNLNHPGYGLSGEGAVLVHWLPQSKVRNDVFGVFLRDIHGFRRPPALNRAETPKEVLHFLARERRSVFDVLRLMLYRCASELLSRHWFELSCEGSVDPGWLRERIEADLQRPPSLGKGEVESDRAWKVVIDHFCKLVSGIAQAYRARFGAANWIGFDLADLSILPVLEGEGDEIMVLLLQPRPVEISTCTILRESQRGELAIESWGEESEMPLDYRFVCGLLTPPARRLLKR